MQPLRSVVNTLRVYWPGDQLCHSCFYIAMRTRGICPLCGHDGVLPGRAHRSYAQPVCLGCAGINSNYQCRTCGTEGEIFRKGQCARCVIRDDLTVLMIIEAADRVAMSTIVDILCDVDRPESIYTWKRSLKVQDLLTGLSSGRIPLTHDGLDDLGGGRQNLVAEVPPPLVAELLGYSYQVAHRHAEIAAQPWSQYTT